MANTNRNLIEEEEKSGEQPAESQEDENELDMDLEGEFTIEEIMDKEEEKKVIGEEQQKHRAERETIKQNICKILYIR